MTALRTVSFALAALALSAAGAHAQTPPDGQKLFMQCKACHSVEKGGKHGVGPNLHGVVGRKAASTDFKLYSPAMKAYGKVWDKTTLDAYLADPRKSIPGNRMAFPGVKKPADREALIKYLETLK